MARKHDQFSGHQFEQTPGDSVGQRSRVCCSPWGQKELDRTESLNNGNTIIEVSLFRNYIRFYHWGRGGGTLGDVLEFLSLKVLEVIFPHSVC